MPNFNITHEVIVKATTDDEAREIYLDRWQSGVFITDELEVEELKGEE